MRNLAKIAAKAGISEQSARDIIVQHHIINKLVTKPKTKTIPLEIDAKTEKWASKIARILKVDFDAVIVYSILVYMEAHPKQKSK